MKYIILDSHSLTPREHQALLEKGDAYSIPRKDVEDLYVAVAASGSVESCAWDFIDGVEAVLAAGFRRIA